ncbi:hypothetical protein D3C72_1304020 [compost metagenome]
MKHDLSLHTEVAAEKKASVRALAGDGSAGCWREEDEGDEIEGVHDQNLIIIFMRQGGGISCSESPVTFGREILRLFSCGVN